MSIHIWNALAGAGLMFLLGYILGVGQGMKRERRLHEQWRKEANE